MRKAILLVAASLAAAGCGSDQPERNDAIEAVAANLAGPANAQDGPDASPTLLATLAEADEFSTLAKAVNAAGLTETLSGAQPYTMFAPTDAAFQKLPAGTMDELLAPEAKGQLAALLTSHIVPGIVTAEDLARATERGKAEFATVGGTTLTFTRTGDAITVATAQGRQARIAAPGRTSANGLIHPIDTVLAP